MMSAVPCTLHPHRSRVIWKMKSFVVIIFVIVISFFIFINHTILIMILVIIATLFVNLEFLNTENVTKNSFFNLIEDWGIYSVTGEMKIKEKFPPPSSDSACDVLFKTTKAPFTALILFQESGRFLCMGSIVDNFHVLSIEKCFQHTNAEDVLVLVGSYSAHWGKNSQVSEVARFLKSEYALMLLRLKRKINYTEFVQPARLPLPGTKTFTDTSKILPKKFFVVGIFVERFDLPGDVLDKRNLYVVKEDEIKPFGDCQSNYTGLQLYPVKSICIAGNATYCWGSWGSPVLIKSPNKYYIQAGIVIADNCTADTTGPLLVARLDHFMEWIFSNSYRSHQPH